MFNFLFINPDSQQVLGRMSSRAKDYPTAYQRAARVAREHGWAVVSV